MNIEIGYAQRYAKNNEDTQSGVLSANLFETFSHLCLTASNLSQIINQKHEINNP
jgi:hypothetical protein